MAVWIGLFRGINVGGNNILPMKELTQTLERAGLSGVRTYIQSGNVVFRSSTRNPVSLADKIGVAVENDFGFKPKILVISADQFSKCANANPYSEAETEPKSLHLFFLAGTPKKANVESLDRLKSATESFSVIRNVLYLHAPNNIGRSKLASKAERTLGIDITARNWRTVTKLMELAQEFR